MGDWILGVEGDSYVAVRRHCTGEREGTPTCDDERQVWAVVVGDKTTHRSFDVFQSVCMYVCMYV